MGSRRNYTEPLDENQKRYREIFGIVDKFLIQMSYDQTKKGYIVYIDTEDDIDWMDSRDIDDNTRQKRDAYITELNIALYSPAPNVSQHDSMAFKKIIGSGYVLALEGKYDKIQSVIDKANQYIIERNKEKSREFFLTSAGVLALVFSVFCVFDLCLWNWKSEWVAGLTMGILGAFVSIWTRYGKIAFKGLSNRFLHYLESTSRLTIGAIFALVAICAVKCGLILAEIENSMQIYAYALIGFISGFSERYIPSIIEHFVIDNNNKEDASKLVAGKLNHI